MVCWVLSVILILFVVSCDSQNETSVKQVADASNTFPSNRQTYVLNTESKKIHTLDCGTGARTSKEKRREYQGNIQTLLDQGYTRCGLCYPN